MDTIFSRDNLRIWRDMDDGSLNFMFIENGKGCVKHPHPVSKQDAFIFMMPYIYELAYFEAYGVPYNLDQYQKAISLQNSLEDWLTSQIAYSKMSLTEARLVLNELYLPTENFSSI